MALFKVFRGLSTELNAVAKTDGHAYFCTDDGSFWIDYKDSNSELQRKQVNDSRFDGLEEGVDQVNLDLEALEDTLREEIKTREIDAKDSDDDIVILTGQKGTNAVEYRAEHKKVFGENKTYVSQNDVTSISGKDEKTVKIPQITVDQYGHVTAAGDQEVKITLPSQFEITATATDDDVVILTGTKGTNGVAYDAKHVKALGKSYTSGNDTTSIDGSAGAGATGTIKIPQISVNEYGHVTATDDEEVEIKIPSVPAYFKIDATGTGDEAIVVSATGGDNSVNYDITHSKNGANTVKGPSQGEVAIANNVTKVIQVPKVTVDEFGHVTALEEHGFSVTIPVPPEVLPNPASLKIGRKTYDGSREIIVDAADLGLTGALVFLGTTTTNIVDASTTNPITVGGKSVTAINGNVVLYGNQEYMWNNTFWELLGDEGSYALKTVQIIAGNGLTGGGQLTGDVTLDVNPGDGIEIISDKVKAKAGNGIIVNANGIHHKDTSSQDSVNNSGRTYIQDIALDEFGHVTAIGSATETVVDTNQTIKVGTTSFDPNDEVSLVAGNYITITPDAAKNTITISSVDTDTHWTSNLIIGASASAKTNAAVTENGKLYLNLVENNTVRNSHNIVGTGGTSITCDANGKITVNSPAYLEATQSTAGLMSADDKKKLDSVAWSAGNITFEYKDGILTITEV